VSAIAPVGAALGEERVVGFELWVLGFGLKKETVFAFVTLAVFEPGFRLGEAAEKKARAQRSSRIHE
jgi:hypothetical protein